MVIQFPLFVSHKPLYQAEYVEKGLLGATSINNIHDIDVVIGFTLNNHISRVLSNT